MFYDKYQTLWPADPMACFSGRAFAAIEFENGEKFPWGINTGKELFLFLLHKCKLTRNIKNGPFQMATIHFNWDQWI
jgi:hypothetical protein